MKKIISLLTITFFLFSFSLITNQFSNYSVGSDFSLKINGTSNVHDWVSTAKEVMGTADISFSESGEMKIEACKIIIPVNSIKSTKGSIMDNKTRKALKSKDFPNIEYSLKIFNDIVFNGKEFTANTIGKLKIAGESQWIDMEVKGKMLNNRNVEISGSKALKMTDFGIDPPTALMGTMTTGDDITVEFKVELNSN